MVTIVGESATWCTEQQGRVRCWILYEAGEMGIINVKQYLMVLVKGRITVVSCAEK